jgi:hypothetical protein
VARLTVEPGELDTITISPESTTLAAGTPQEFVVAGFDASGNSLGPVAATLAMSFGSCEGTVCVSTTPGEQTVTASAGDLDAMATVVVVPGALATLTLSPEEATVDAGTGQAYATVGFDAYGNSLGPVAASYTVTGGTCTGEVCLATGAGEHTVIAGFGGATDSSRLIVLTGPAAQLVLTHVDPYSPPLTIDCTPVGFRATILDAYGNVVDDDTSVVTFDATGAGTPAFPNGGTAVATGGVAQITVEYGYPYGSATVQAALGAILSNTVQVTVGYCIG